MHGLPYILNGVRLFFSLQAFGRQNCWAGASEQNQPALAGGLGTQYRDEEAAGPGGEGFWAGFWQAIPPGPVPEIPALQAVPEAHLQCGREQPVAPEQVPAWFPLACVKLSLDLCFLGESFYLLHVWCDCETAYLYLREKKYYLGLLLSIACFLSPYRIHVGQFSPLAFLPLPLIVWPCLWWRRRYLNGPEDHNPLRLQTEPSFILAAEWCSPSPATLSVSRIGNTSCFPPYG